MLVGGNSGDGGVWCSIVPLKPWLQLQQRLWHHYRPFVVGACSFACNTFVSMLRSKAVMPQPGGSARRGCGLCGVIRVRGYTHLSSCGAHSQGNCAVLSGPMGCVCLDSCGISVVGFRGDAEGSGTVDLLGFVLSWLGVVQAAGLFCTTIVPAYFRAQQSRSNMWIFTCNTMSIADLHWFFA